MKTYAASNIRNIAILGHGSSGKTTFTEGLLYTAGAIDRMGTTDAGNTISDFDFEEIKRKISIYTSIAPVEWKNTKINILDTPGYDEFIGETLKAIAVVDSAIILVDSVSGVEVGTERAWELLEERHIPRVFYVSKLDKENSNFDSAFESIQKNLTLKVMPVIIPMGEKTSFEGLIDLLKMKAIKFTSPDGKKSEIMEIPAKYQDHAAKYREKMLEAVVEADDTLMEKFLEGQEISEADILSALQKGIRECLVFPLLSGIALQNRGSEQFLDFAVSYLPAPDSKVAKGIDPKTGQPAERKCDISEPFSAFAFKVMNEPNIGDLTFVKILSGQIKQGEDMWNTTQDQPERAGQLFAMRGKNRIELEELSAGDIGCFVKLKNTKTCDTLSNPNNRIKYEPIQFPPTLLSLAVRPKTKADQEKLSLSLAKITEEDPTLKMSIVTEFAETIVSGMGEIHIDVSIQKMQRRYKVECSLDAPRIPYRETIRAKARAQGKHKRQSGGRGQYGDCHLELEPLPGGNFEFVDKIVGGVIPRNYIPAVEKGVREAMANGVIAGYPVIDIRATVFDGSYHEVDSSEMAFKIAGSLGFKKAFLEAQPVLLEPIHLVEIKVPEAYTGDIMGDLNARRGRVIGIENVGKYAIIRATVPLAEMYKYVTNLKSMTQGRGTFTMQFDHYEEVPAHISQQIIQKYQAEKKEEE